MTTANRYPKNNPPVDPFETETENDPEDYWVITTTLTNREAARTASRKAELLSNALYDNLCSICARPNAFTPGPKTIIGLLDVAAQIQRRMDECVLALVELQAEEYMGRLK